MDIAGRTRAEERADRLTRIAEVVMSAGTVRIDELVELTQVSLMTMHRDLDTLAAQGVLRKTRGQVTALGTTLNEASTEYRMRIMSAEKAAVARCALSYLEPGQSLIIDDSTTGMYLADQLPSRYPLTVITNFQPMMDRLAGQQDLSLIALGGQFFPWCRSYMGAVTLRALEHLSADVLFMSTSAITLDLCSHQHYDTVLVKEAMFRAAGTRILYVDHSKFARRALHTLLPLTEFDHVIVDGRTPREHIDRLIAKGVKLDVAPLAPAVTAEARTS